MQIQVEVINWLLHFIFSLQGFGSEGKVHFIIQYDVEALTPSLQLISTKDLEELGQASD